MSEKILIIDDDVDSLRLISLILQRHGYNVITAGTGNQGIVKATNDLPNLIILDVMMPDMDGYEVCRRLRANSITQAIPIIMFTAKVTIEDKMTGFEAGADDYVTKPTHPAELVNRIKAILQRSARPQQKTKSEYGLTIGVLGAKGGIGTTTIALNLAAAFNSMGENPLVADFRPGSGGLGLLLGIRQANGMANLLRRPVSEIPGSAGRELITHATGLRTLLSSIDPREALLPFSIEVISAVIRELQAIGKLVILDLGSGYSSIISQVQNEIDKLIVLVEPTTVGLAMAKELLKELLRNDQNRIRVVIVNPNNFPIHLSWHEIELALECEVNAMIAAAPELALAAMDTGVPIVNYQPGAVLSGQMHQLAQSLQATAKTR